MQTNDAIKHMLSNAGLSPYSASLAMGKAHSYLDSALRRKGGMSAIVLARIASACGWRLVLEREDGSDRIGIDPRE